MIATRALVFVAATLIATSLAGMAVALTLPAGAELKAASNDAAGRYALPVGAWVDGTGVPARILSGQVTRQAWRLGGTGLTSYQILLRLRGQLEDAGFEVIFDCDATSCGGFDFRYGTEVIGEPEMHVDLGDFYFLSAAKPGTEEAVSLLVSRSASAGYVQIIEVGTMAALPDVAAPAVSTKAEPGVALPAEITGEVGTALENVGRFVLSDLVFATGSAELGPGAFSSLDDLARYLKNNPSKRVALVGHTDATGALAGNISLSERRAQSVMSRLEDTYGVPASQLEAEGVGYLSPIATNQTEDGRTANRRVEAILVSTE